MVRLLPLVVLGLALSACESLPHDGPSAARVEESAQSDLYALVELDYAAARAVAAHPPAALRTLAPVSSLAPVDLIGEGDVLSVTVYEPGAGPSAGNDDDTGDGDSRQSLPRATVDRAGTITVPYAGNVPVAGLTPQQASTAIRNALRGRLINPQVVVTLVTNVANAVTVIGEVRDSGRYALSAREPLAEASAWRAYPVILNSFNSAAAIRREPGGPAIPDRLAKLVRSFAPPN